MKTILISVFMLMAITGIAVAIDDQGFCAASDECSDGIECTLDTCSTEVNLLSTDKMEIIGGYCQSSIAADGTRCSIGTCSNGFCQRVDVPHARGKRTVESAIVVQTLAVPAEAALQNEPENSVPEFSAVAAGLAFAGAGAGYMLLRKMR